MDISLRHRTSVHQGILKGKVIHLVIAALTFPGSEIPFEVLEREHHVPLPKARSTRHVVSAMRVATERRQGTISELNRRGPDPGLVSPKAASVPGRFQKPPRSDVVFGQGSQPIQEKPLSLANAAAMR
jgi:hypothetical protein